MCDPVHDPLFVSGPVSDIARQADVDYATARQCYMAGMEVYEATVWLRWGQRHGKSVDQILEIWRRRRARGRRALP